MAALPLTTLLGPALLAAVAIVLAGLVAWMLRRRRGSARAGGTTPLAIEAHASDLVVVPAEPPAVMDELRPACTADHRRTVVDLPPISFPPSRRVPKPIEQPRLVSNRHLPDEHSDHRPGRRRRASRGDAGGQGLGYAELSRSYAALGRAEAAAMAQWAADLRLIGPLMGARGQGHGLPDRLLDLGGGSPRSSVTRARDEVMSLVAESAADWLVPPMFPSASHVSDLPGQSSCTVLTVVTTPDELRQQAAELMMRAVVLADVDPVTSRQEARRADLAALDAVLLDSAALYSDVGLVSVELRQQFAAAELHHRDLVADDLALGAEVERTRSVLRSVLEPHELGRFEEALAEAPRVETSAR